MARRAAQITQQLSDSQRQSVITLSAEHDRVVQLLSDTERALAAVMRERDAAQAQLGLRDRFHLGRFGKSDRKKDVEALDVRLAALADEVGTHKAALIACDGHVYQLVGQVATDVADKDNAARFLRRAITESNELARQIDRAQDEVQDALDQSSGRPYRVGRRRGSFGTIATLNTARETSQARSAVEALQGALARWLSMAQQGQHLLAPPSGAQVQWKGNAWLSLTSLTSSLFLNKQIRETRDGLNHLREVVMGYRAQAQAVLDPIDRELSQLRQALVYAVGP